MSRTARFWESLEELHVTVGLKRDDDESIQLVQEAAKAIGVDMPRGDAKQALRDFLHK